MAFILCIVYEYFDIVVAVFCYSSSGILN